MVTKPIEVYYKTELGMIDNIEGKEKWLNEKMQTNRAILAKVNERLATYDQMKPEDPALLEMESKSILEAIMAILMVPDIQKYIS